MSLSRLDLLAYDLPFRRPVRVGGQLHASRRGLLVRVSADGVNGWGEAAALPWDDSACMEPVVRELEAIGARLDGGWYPEAHELVAAAESPWAQFALDTALREIEARSKGHEALAETLPIRRGRVPLARLVDDDNFPEDGAPPVGDNVPHQIAVKVKVGTARVDEEVSKLKALRVQVGEAVRLRADANRTWDLDQATAFVRGCAGVDLDYLEEPVRAREDLVALQEQTAIPLAVDESLQEALFEMRANEGIRQDARRAVHGDEALLLAALRTLPDVPVWVVKPSAIGSWSGVLSIMKIAQEQGRRVVLSSAYETGVGMRALTALAAASPFDDPAGFDTYERLAADVLLPRPVIRPPFVDVLDVTSLWRGVNEASPHIFRLASDHVQG